MGITPKDIAAQRAMIDRGEEKRKRLRDKFAAAALTGLLSNIPRYQLGVIAVQAYDIADEMLRERMRNGAVEGRETVQSDRPSGVSSAFAEATNQQLRERGYYGSSFPYTQGPRSTNHDAAVAGNTPSKAEIDALEFVVEEGRTASIDDYGILRSWLVRLRPEWESQSYEESDEKRVNTTTNRDTTPTVGTDAAAHQTCPHVRGTVTQHCSLNFTLSDEERAAIEDAIKTVSEALDLIEGEDCLTTATLRNLLERLK